MQTLKIDQKRHVAKTLTWRIIGTIDTFLLSWLITGDPIVGLSIGGVEVFTKMILYYLHERTWIKINWGIQRPRKAANPIKWFPETGYEHTLERQLAFIEDESDGWVKRAKITQSIKKPDQYTVHLSYFVKDTNERYADVFIGSKEDIENCYNIRLDD